MFKKFINPYYHTSASDTVELLSIHVPRSGTSTFKKLLQKLYGKSSIMYAYDETKLQAIREGKELALNTRVLHGPFSASQELKNQFPDAKLITWLRDPVQRAISHYYYWKDIPPHGNPDHDLFLTKTYTIEAFVEEFSIHLQVMSLFQSFEVSDFDFIGIAENYTSEIIELAQLMEWKSYPNYRLYLNKNKTIDHTTEMRLKELLKDEIAIYEQAKRIRNLC